MARKIEAEKQRLIITYLITSDEFCRQIFPMILSNENLVMESFTSFSRIVLKWIISYYLKYKKAPKKHIQKIYQEEKENPLNNEDDLELVSDFLKDLSENFEVQENFNIQYVIDISLKFLRKTILKNLSKNIREAVETEQEEEAEKLISSYREVKRETEPVDEVDFFSDLSAIGDALNTEDETLFKLPGDLGKAMGDFCRGDLIAFAAPAKRGKTWFLFEFAIRAVLQKLRVLIFSFEMPKNQCLRRMVQGILGEVKKVPDGEDGVEVEIPYFVFNEEQNIYSIETKKKRKFGVTYEKAIQKIGAIKTMIKRGGLKIICPPAFSMTSRQMVQKMDELLIKENFVPDVVIIDYADITAPEKGSAKDYRHQIDSIWKGERAMAQSRHCLVVTATHTNKKTFDKDIGQGDASEDIRKVNHVACMVAINQNSEEKKIGVARASVIAHRHDDFNELNQVVLLQSLKLGKPLLDSKFLSSTDYVIPKIDRKKKGGE